MVVKSDYAQASIRQRPAPSRKFHWPVLRRPVARLVLKAGTPALAFVTVFCGLPGSPEDLEKMGIHLGPTHL